jgi:hypothetical protein
MYIIKLGKNISTRPSVFEAQCVMNDAYYEEAIGTTKEMVIDRLKKEADVDDSSTAKYVASVLDDEKKLNVVFGKLVSENIRSYFKIGEEYDSKKNNTPISFRVETSAEREKREEYEKKTAEENDNDSQEVFKASIIYHLYSVDDDKVKLLKTHTSLTMLVRDLRHYGIDVKTAADVKFKHIYKSDDGLLKYKITKTIIEDVWYALYIILPSGQEKGKAKALSDVNKIIKYLYEYGIYINPDTVEEDIKSNKVWKSKDGQWSFRIGKSNTDPGKKDPISTNSHIPAQVKAKSEKVPTNTLAKDTTVGASSETTPKLKLPREMMVVNQAIESNAPFQLRSGFKLIGNTTPSKTYVAHNPTGYKNVTEKYDVSYWIFYEKADLLFIRVGDKWLHNPKMVENASFKFLSFIIKSEPWDSSR